MITYTMKRAHMRASLILTDNGDCLDVLAYVMDRSENESTNVDVLLIGDFLSIHMTRVQTEKLITYLTDFVSSPAADILGKPLAAVQSTEPEGPTPEGSQGGQNV